jgi:hypothetical protein
MAAFPVLSVAAAVNDYEETVAQDPTLRHETDGGYVITGTRFTGTPPDKYHVRYDPITEAEKATLKTFQAQQGVGAVMFDWTNPFTSAILSVRLLSPMKFKPRKGVPGLWSMEMDIEEV